MNHGATALVFFAFLFLVVSFGRDEMKEGECSSLSIARERKDGKRSREKSPQS